MKLTLGAFLPKVLPADLAVTIIQHEGKSDLKASVPRKIRAWANHEARFMVLMDNDGADCLARKSALVDLCRHGPDRHFRVRIVVQELESWFLGDLEAVESSGLDLRRPLARIRNKAKYRDPDRLNNAKQELQSLVPSYWPRRGARAIAPHLDPPRNRSHSFQVFVAGLKNLLED